MKTKEREFLCPYCFRLYTLSPQEVEGRREFLCACGRFFKLDKRGGEIE